MAVAAGVTVNNGGPTMSVVCRDVFWLNDKGALLHRVVPAMLADHMSVSTSQWSEKRSMASHQLILTTLAEEEAQLTIELQEYDRLQEFENAVLEQLPELGTSSTFCCELDFVCRNSQQKLVDPSGKPCGCNCFTVVVSPCAEKAEHKAAVMHCTESSPQLVENLEHRYLKSALPCCKLEAITTLFNQLAAARSDS